MIDGVDKALVENLVTRLRLITESAQRYTENDSWIVTLTNDIRLAHQALQEWDDAYPDDEEDD